tara:strand:- start:2602 stop:2709 length:108 start_codon:yes stop_codon:yes gene_type:complete
MALNILPKVTQAKPREVIANIIKISRSRLDNITFY